MRRGLYRTHGCSKCKARKVKCDNKLPECSQCIRLKIPCPGSTAGRFFYRCLARRDATKQPSVPPAERGDETRTVRPLALDAHSTSNSSNIGISDWIRPLSSKRQNLAYRLAAEAGAYYYAPWTSRPWLLEIPRLALPTQVHEIISFPLEAIVTVLKTLERSNARNVDTAFRKYAIGLQKQRLQLTQAEFSSKPATRESVLWLLLTTMSLLEFEMMAPISPHSWFAHAHGAVQLLVMAGPESCQQSPFFEMFRHLRFVMAYITLCTTKPCQLSAPTWTLTPFRGRSKTEFDFLIDTMLQRNSFPHQGMIGEAKLELASCSSIEDLKLSGYLPANDAVRSRAYKRMFRILLNLPRFVNAPFPEPPISYRISLANSVYADAQSLLDGPDISYNAAQQAMFALKLVGLHAPSEPLRRMADEKFSQWFERLTIVPGLALGITVG